MDPTIQVNIREYILMNFTILTPKIFNNFSSCEVLIFFIFRIVTFYKIVNYSKLVDYYIIN